MILPDVNLLIYAHNVDAPHHSAAREWFERSLSGIEPVCLAWVTILGFIRLTTNRLVLANPMHVRDAVERVEEWLAQPSVRIVHPTPRHAEILFEFLRALGTGGNLTTDAHLAALAVEYGCTLCTTDVDFARFAGLRWTNPLTTTRRRSLR